MANQEAGPKCRPAMEDRERAKVRLEDSGEGGTPLDVGQKAGYDSRTPLEVRLETGDDGRISLVVGYETGSEGRTHAEVDDIGKSHLEAINMAVDQDRTRLECRTKDQWLEIRAGG